MLEASRFDISLQAKAREEVSAGSDFTVVDTTLWRQTKKVLNPPLSVEQAKSVVRLCFQNLLLSAHQVKHTG